MVTSNPAPAYVGRCSAAFANNGSGVAGRHQGGAYGHLARSEARGDVKTDPNFGHLREPVLLIDASAARVQTPRPMGCWLRTLAAVSVRLLGQNVFNPPTVFSYFPADFGLPGTIWLVRSSASSTRPQPMRGRTS